MTIKIILAAIGAAIAYFLHSSYSDASDEATFTRLLSTVFAGFYVGLLGVFYVLPAISHKAAQSMFSDSNESPDQDLLNGARALMAQGDYESAIVSYRRAIIKVPSNRLAWTDMAKLYAEKLEQPKLAVASLREAYDEHEWEEDDAAFLLFRISEWQLDDCGDQEAGAATLSEVIEAFPDTRHSANAVQQLQQLGYKVKIGVKAESE
ncbi:MAG: tetratricopeptide (TPR) repeat protein [Cryomorphaceae bacterium]|jgi:tetratricopeptide (TPR) repeat protein